MPAMTHAAAPTSSPDGTMPPAPSGRLMALDAARAVAIIGMIAVNVGPRNGGGWAGHLYQIPLGRSSLLFMLLAGLGMSLLTRSARRPGGSVPWRTIVWRAALLTVGGLALQLMGHDVSVILPTYGLLFLLCLPLLKAPAAVLASAAAVLFAVGPVLWIAAQVAGGETYRFVPPTLADGPAEILHRIVLSGPYPALVWAVPFLVGMALGRADLGERSVQKRLAVWGGAAMVGGYLLYRLLVALVGEPGESIGFDRLVSGVNHSQMPLWLLSGTGSAALVLALFLLGGDAVARRLGPLVSVGRLSLTIYVGHLLLLAMLVRPEPHALHQGILISAAISLAAVLFAALWTRRFRYGPLEALLRWPPPKAAPDAAERR